MSLDRRELDAYLSQSDEDAHPEWFEESDHDLGVVVEQLRQIRDEGRVNMMDMLSVQGVCNTEQFQLIDFIADLEDLPRSERAQRWMDVLNQI